MIKIIIGFVIFSALAIFILMKGGDIDMGGEQHGGDITHSEPKPEAPAAAPAAPAQESPAK